jgi:SAM-dependent methyltransferase
MSARCSAVIREIHKAITGVLGEVRADRGGQSLSLLDVGCWDGVTTAAYRNVLGGPASGVEVYAEQAARAEALGIAVVGADLELSPLPWPDASFDVVVVNQVFEHLKNVWLPMAEVARVLKPGGHLVFSVPNLASLHNRVMLAFGRQPSSIRTFGPHVRGFTYRQAREFVEFEGFYEIVRARGVGFYPLPARMTGPIANAWIGASHTPILVARRKAGAGVVPPWSRIAAEGMGEQTYYAGTSAAP